MQLRRPTSRLVTSPQALFDPRGYLWFGVSDSYGIIQVDLTSGDTLRIIEKDYDSVPVSRAEREAALRVQCLVRMRIEGR